MSPPKGIHKECPRNCLCFISNNCEPVKITLTEEQLKGLFKRYDSDGDGRLTNQELKEAFNSLGSRCPAWRAWRARCYADTNGDGYISQGEFDALVSYFVKSGYARK